ncbi:hypothetical protein V6N13_002271 [Hibiscus sabdariffa]
MKKFQQLPAMMMQNDWNCLNCSKVSVEWKILSSETKGGAFLVSPKAVSSYFTAACSQYSCTCRWIHRSVQQGPLPPANQRPLVGTKLRWRTLLWNLNSRNQLLQKNNDKFNRLNQAVCQRFAGNYVVTIEETRVRGNCRLAQLLTEQSIVQSEAGDIIG